MNIIYNGVVGNYHSIFLYIVERSAFKNFFTQEDHERQYG